MRIQTTDFGELEVQEENIIDFPRGLFGFEQIKQYVLLHYDAEESPIMCLQSVSGEVSFTVVDPFCFVAGYAPAVGAEEQAYLAAEDPGQLRYLAIAIIGAEMEQTVVNLKSPIVLNPTNHRGMQVILTEGDYAQRYPLFPGEDVKEHAGGQP